MYYTMLFCPYPGGRFQGTQTGGSLRGMSGARFRTQMAGPGVQNVQRGPVFNTPSIAGNPNMNIQFQPLPNNQRVQPARFNPNSAFNTQFRPDVSQQFNQNQNAQSNTAGSAGQGQAFSITRETQALNAGPAEFQIVRVGNLPEFSQNIGNRLDVRMQGKYMSRDKRFPTIWFVRPAKAQTSLRISTV